MVAFTQRLLLVTLFFGLTLVPSFHGLVQAAGTFELKDGDRVVLIGDALIEQEQYCGWIEVMMTTAFPERDVTFRNLGWSGDTPAGASRFGLSLLQAGREPADEGWKQLQKQIELTKPTVAVLGYGMASALQASAASTDDEKIHSMDQFSENLTRLAKTIRSIEPNCRFLFLSPLVPHGESSLTAGLADSYAQRVEQVAEKVDGRYVDLTDVAKDEELRKDPVHLNDAGYRAAAISIADELGIDEGQWQSSEQTESLRQVILEKNRFWFHRSRPANMAYVFGFRKHEQGQNAVEIPQFDSLIEKEEARIAKLRSLRSGQPGKTKTHVESKYAEFTPQPTPEFVVADDLEVTLWAENPMLNKPIHMNFDPQGRLWVASSEAYPMIEVGQAMPDKVLVLEDTNQDGKADKSLVFADQLLIPTGVAPGDGGVYVAQSTDVLFLKDTDGDGKADHRERILSGFGTEDTHHNLHTLLFGPDGRLYMNQSVYTRTDTETPYGVVRLKAGGGFRYDTQTGRMGVLFQGLWNPWGHRFDAYGNSFMTDGAGFAGIAYVFPGAKFNPTPGARQVLDLISPGNYPKFCGAEIVYGSSFPESWQGSLITCDFRANRVTRFSISESESGFVTNQEADLIRTTASSFRPIDVKQGPDGALYIADWSNPIINHGEVDFRDPRRDRWHGRIWRVAFKDRARRQPAGLAKLKTDQLIQHLYSGDRYLADQSRRVLIENAKQTKQQLSAVWQAAKAPVDQLAAVRLSSAVGDPKHQWLETILGCDDGAARAAATRILGQWSDPTDRRSTIEHDQAIEWLTGRINDENGRARLEAVCALARLGGNDAIRLSLRALDHQVDRFINHALFVTVDQNADAIVDDLNQDWWTQAANQKQLEFVLTNIEASKASAFLSDYLTKHEIAGDGRGPWIQLIAKAGGPQELAMLYRQAIDGGLDSQATAAAFKALQDAKRFRKLMPKMQRKPAQDLRPLLTSSNETIQQAAIELCGAWQLRFLVPVLANVASSTDASESVRTKAVGALRSCGGDAAVESLVKLAQSEATISFKTAVIAALASLDARQALDPFYDALESIDNEQNALSLWRPMLAAKNGQGLLTGSLSGKEISQTAARAGIRASGEGGRQAQGLVDLLMPISGLSMTASKWSPEHAAEIRRLVEMKGDALRGELVYRKTNLQCATCHSIGGVGGKVGPDMTSLGASAPVDYIIESMFDPNAKIKENYHSVTVLTEDGQIVSGIESGSTDDEMVLRDASNKLIRIPDADVAAVKPGKSLMPEGLLDRVSQQDQLDLIKFLTQLGRPGEFDASRQTVARVMGLFAGNHRIEQQGNKDIVSGERKEGWKPLQARVSGKVEREILERLTVQPRNISLVNIYLRTRIEVGAATKATFEVENIDRAKVWIDGQEAGEINQPISIQPGKHTLLIQIDGRDLPEFIRIRSEDVTFVTDDQSSEQ